MTYQWERPEVEGDDLTDAQKAAVGLKTKIMLLEAEKAQRAAAEKAKPPPAPAPAPEQPTYPITLDDGRVMYGSWNDLADPFVDKFHPRNDPNDAAYRAALKDRTKNQIQQNLRQMPKVDESGFEVDEDGNRLPTVFDAMVEQRQAAEKAVLETRPVWRADGTEWLYPDKPEDDPSNDPHYVEVGQEQKRRERALRAAFINARPKSHRSGSVQDEMREAGYLPDLRSDDEKRRDQVLTQSRENINRAFQQADPNYQTDKQRRINELLIKGDLASRKLASDIMDGRVA